jgi:nitroreductase
VLDAVIIKYVKWFYKLVYRSRFVTRILQWITPEVDRKNQVKIARGLAMGRTYKTIPAAQVYIVGDRRIVLSEVSAHYALYNMILMAQAKGIGSRIKAAGSLILDRTKTARNILGLKKREHILATLDLGYPAVRFKNKVEGKCMPIEWVGGAVNVN